MKLLCSNVFNRHSLKIYHVFQAKESLRSDATGRVRKRIRETNSAGENSSFIFTDLTQTVKMIELFSPTRLLHMSFLTLFMPTFLPFKGRGGGVFRDPLMISGTIKASTT